MNLALLTLLLALGWTAATGSLSLPNLLLGAVIGAAGLFLVRDRVGYPKFWSQLWRILALAWLFLKELVLSAVRVAVLVLRPDMDRHLNPAFLAFPLSITSPAQITLLANLVTLTPGTLSADVSEDGRFLHIHALDLTDREAFIRELREGFETKVREACE